MSGQQRAIGLMVACLMGCAGTSSSGSALRQPPLRCPQHEGFKAPVRLPFGFYSLPIRRFEQVAEAGVTMVGPYYGEAPDGLHAAAQAQGLGVIETIGAKEILSFEDTDDAKRFDVELDAALAHDAVVAWYVLPEERRPWVPADLAYLAQIRARVRQRDAQHRPLLGYQPNHRSAKALATASASFDVVSRGVYTNYVGARDQRAWVRGGVEAIVEASGPRQRPWVVLEMFEQPHDAHLDAVADWVRHDVYASVVAGARGVLVFSGWPRQGFEAYEDYLDAYLQVANELNGPRGLASVVMGGTLREGIGARVLEGPPTVRIATPRALRVESSIAVRALLFEGATWVFAVNSAKEAVRVELSGIESGCAIESMLGPAPAFDGLSMPPLSAVVLRIADPAR